MNIYILEDILILWLIRELPSSDSCSSSNILHLDIYLTCKLSCPWISHSHRHSGPCDHIDNTDQWDQTAFHAWEQDLGIGFGYDLLKFPLELSDQQSSLKNSRTSSSFKACTWESRHVWQLQGRLLTFHQGLSQHPQHPLHLQILQRQIQEDF